MPAVAYFRTYSYTPKMSPLISYSLARLPPSGASARSALTQLEIVVTVHDPTREPGKAGTAGAIS